MAIGTNNFFPLGGGGGFPGMNQGMGIPGMDSGMGMPAMMGSGFGAQQMMMSGMMLMMTAMMSQMTQMMAQNMGQFPMSMMPGGFGMPGMGMPPNGPLGNFLGMGSMPQGFRGTQSSGGGMAPSGPAGDVGNVDIGRLVAAVPSSRQKAAQKNFPYIVAEAKTQGVTNKAQLAYILATAVHESGAGQHMEEIDSGRKYEGRRTLGNTQSGDGVRYKGRGYVQLTGRRNYADWSKRLGMDLVGNPDAVKDPKIAAKILVGGMMKGTFTGKGLGSYINGQKTDFNGARRTVNGTDRAGLIGGIAQKLLAALG